LSSSAQAIDVNNAKIDVNKTTVRM